MGTNYFLHRDPDVCPTCERPRADATVHIGNAASGWVFLWRGYRGDDQVVAGREILTPEDWWSFLNEQVAAGALIKDDSDRPVTVTELAQLVERQATATPSGRAPQRPARLCPQDTVSCGSSDVSFVEFS